jgi:hypothetical protein
LIAKQDQGGQQDRQQDAVGQKKLPEESGTVHILQIGVK